MPFPDRVALFQKYVNIIAACLNFRHEPFAAISGSTFKNRQAYLDYSSLPPSAISWCAAESCEYNTYRWLGIMRTRRLDTRETGQPAHDHTGRKKVSINYHCPRRKRNI